MAEVEIEYVRRASPLPVSWRASARFVRAQRSLASLTRARKRAVRSAPRASGPQVKLISAEGHEFVIDRNAAVVSGTIKSMLQGPGERVSPCER